MRRVNHTVSLCTLAALAALTLTLGACSRPGVTQIHVSSAGGLASGDEVGMDLFSPEARAVARGERSAMQRPLAAVRQD